MYQAQMQYRPVIMNGFVTPYQMNYQPMYFPQAQAPFISTSNGVMVGYMQPSNNGYYYQHPQHQYQQSQMNQMKKKQICSYFLKEGTCKHGNNCRFQHQHPAQTPMSAGSNSSNVDGGALYNGQFEVPHLNLNNESSKFMLSTHSTIPLSVASHSIASSPSLAAMSESSRDVSQEAVSFIDEFSYIEKRQN